MNAQPDFAGLCRVLEDEARMLTQLRDEMVRRRAAFIAVRPSELEGSVQQLDGIQRESAQLETKRVELTLAIGKSLGLEGEPSLRTLCRRAPASLSRRLEKAGAAVRTAARAVQIESRVGARLLDTSRLAQEGILHDIAGIASKAPTTGYDRNAAVSQAPRSGSLINGTI